MSVALRALPPLLAFGLVACGGADQPAAPAGGQVAQAPPAATASPTQTAPPQAPTQTATPPQATPSATATTTVTERAAATATPDQRAVARQTPAPTATPVPKSTATPTPTPAAERRKKLNGPLTCLTEADLKKPTKNGTGLWSGSLDGPDDLVAVDGPYPSPRDAQLSVEGLRGVSDAEVGGNYVVSASLATKAKAVVSQVADCLDARDS